MGDLLGVRAASNHTASLGTGTIISNTTATSSMNCSASWNSYYNASIANTFYDLRTYYKTYTYHNITVSTTVACDGHTRIVGDLTTTATGTNSTLTSAPRRFTNAKPTCEPAAADCSSLWDMYYEFPCTQTKGFKCGACHIEGGTVQLIYFPVTTNTSRNLCPSNSPGTPTLCPLGPTVHPYSVTNPYEYSPCAYATQTGYNATATTQNSGPYVVSGGNTFYHNRAYISLKSVYATDECGRVGKQLPGTILTLQSSDIYSIAGYHHGFEDVGYQVNFADFSSVPASAYYMACDAGGPASCEYTGTRYRVGTDFIDGMSTIDLGVEYAAEYGLNTTVEWIWDQAYAPTLLAPLQLRTLDPAWSTCSLDIGGLYDPPTALSQQLVYPTPTVPFSPTSDTAKPGGGPTSKSAPATAEPITTSAPQSPGQNPTSGGGDPNPPSIPTGGASKTPGSPPNQPQTSQGQAPDPPETSTRRSVGGIVASVLGISRSPQASNGSPNNPAPATTTNAESILSAAQGAFTDPDTTGTQDATGGQDPASAVADPTVITANGVAHTIADVSGSTGVYVVDGSQTVTQGASAVTIDGLTISAGSSGQIVAGSRTLTLGADPQSQPSADSVTGSDGSSLVISAVSGTSGVYEVDGTTVSVGGPAETVDGIIISAGSSGEIIAGSQTIAVSAQSQSPAQKTVDFFTGTDGSGLSVSAISGSSGVYEVGGSTISVGGPAETIDGVKVSAGSNGVFTMGSSSTAGSASMSETGAATPSKGAAEANRANVGPVIWLVCLVCSIVWLP